MVAEVASIAVTLSLLGVDKFQADMRGAGTISEQTGVRVARSIDGIASATGRAARASEGMNRGDGALRSLAISALRAETSVAALTKGLTAAGAAVGGLAGGVAFNAFKNYADTATTIANKLAVVIPIQQQRAVIDQEVFNIAQRTRTAYESTASIYSRMSLSSKELGASQADVLRVVETTQKALKAGGATSSEAASIATQLTQALGSGRGLAGDELKSIAENSPILLQAIATEFGVTTGALKDMGANGQLEAKRVFDAIKKAGTEVDRVFAEATPTIADGIQQIDNALTRYIGSVDKSLGATKALTQALAFVSNNIGNIGDATGIAVAGLAGSLIGRGATKATKAAIIDPFREARDRAYSNLAAARDLETTRFAERTKALGSALAARYALQQIERAPSASLAGPKAIADLMAAEKRVQGQRDSLEAATKKVAEAEAKRNAIAAETVTASKGVVQGEERAAAAILRTREALAKGVTDYGTRAGAISTVAGELPKRAAERLAAQVKERETLQAKLAEVDARAAATQADIAAASTPAAGKRTRASAERLAALEADIKSQVDSRNALGRALQEAIRTSNEKEGALEAANLSARAKAADEVERLGARLVSAETSVVKAREDLAARALKTAPGGLPPVQAAREALRSRLAQEEAVAEAARQDLAAKAAKTAPGAPVRTVPTVLKYIEAEIEAQERLAVAEKSVAKARAELADHEAKNVRSVPNVMKAIEEEVRSQENLAAAVRKRDALSASYLDAMARAPQASGSLGAVDVKALNEARRARDVLMREFDAIDSQITAKMAERDARAAAIAPRSQRNLARDVANASRVGELNAALTAATSERDEITKRMATLDERIVAGEQDLAARTQAARQKAIEGAVASGQRLREIQGTLVADLATLNERRKATIASEVLNESARAQRLAEINAQIKDNSEAQAGIKRAIDSSDRGVAKARQAVELEAQGQRAAAAAATVQADAAIVASRKATEEVANTVKRAERAATATAIVGAVARSSLTSLGGVVNFLGGPFAAILTAAGAGMAGYAIIQARAAAEAEKHAEALKNLAGRTAELKALQEKGGARTETERQRDTVQQRDAARGVVDLRNKALDAYGSAAAVADRRVSLGDASGLAGTVPNDLDKAADRLGLSLGLVVRGVRELPKASLEAAAATQQLADILTEAARLDPRYAERAIEAQGFAKAQREAAQAAKERTDAEAAIKDVENRLRSRKAVYDADDGGPLIRTPIFDAARVKEETDAITSYVKGIGDSITKLGGETVQFPELTAMRAQFQAAVQDLAQAKITAQSTLAGSFIAPTALVDTVKQFAAGKTTVEEYATALQAARDSMPNFRPLIDSLIEAANQGLRGSAALQELDAKRAALDGSTATITVNVVQRSIGQVRAEDGKAIADQEAAAEKSMLDMASKTRSLQLQAAGKKAEAKALELKAQSPGINLAEATAAFKEQEKLEEQIAANAKAARGGGKKPKKSQEEKDGETLAKKLQELDQDSRVAGLDSFDQKTVRFAQSAKVATDQIEAFINAARAGDMSNLPPTMQAIYEKMMLLEGVKLAKSALDEIYPYRKLARELLELKAAADASPEIAANLELIEARIRADNAPEWAKGLTSGVKDAAKSVADGTTSIGDALETLKRKIMGLALDQAFKPFETAFTSMLSKLGGDNAGGFDLLGMFGLGKSSTGGLTSESAFNAGADASITSWLADGGLVGGNGGPTADDQLVAASTGEFMVKASATKKHLPLLRAINEDRLVQRAQGGMIGTAIGAMTMPAADAARAAMGQASTAASTAPPMKSELHIHGGAAKTEAQTSNGPMGPRTDVWLDKNVAAMLLSGPNTREALKKLTGSRMVGG